MIKIVVENKSYPAPLTTKQMTYVANRWKKNAQQMLRRQKQKKYTRESFDLINSDTRNFSYTTKKPPLSAMIGWIKTKGYKGRDEKTGRYISDKSFGFALQNAIYLRGMKPSYFISKTGNNILKKYSQSIGDAVAQDIANITMELI